MATTVPFEFKLATLKGDKRAAAFKIAAEFLRRASGAGGVDGAIKWWNNQKAGKTTSKVEIKSEKEEVAVATTFIPGLKPRPLEPTLAFEAKKKTEEKEKVKQESNIDNSDIEIALKASLGKLKILNTAPLEQENAIVKIENNSDLNKFPYVRALLEVMNDVSDIYSSNEQFNQNQLLRDGLMTQADILTSKNQIRKAFTLKNGKVISIETQGDLLFPTNTFLINSDFTVATTTSTAARFAMAIFFMLRIYFKKTTIGLGNTSLQKYTDFKRNKNINMYAEFINTLSKTALNLKLDLQADSKSSINQIKNELEIVETMNQYFDPVSKKYNVENVYKHLLAPLNAVFNNYKTDIDDVKGHDALQRLVNVGIFQRFPENAGMQTKYLHSMSIAANMLESHLVNGQIDPSDVERSYIEWPFEIAPGTTFDI
jgi:hypothetical protein